MVDSFSCFFTVLSPISYEAKAGGCEDSSSMESYFIVLSWCISDKANKKAFWEGSEGIVELSLKCCLSGCWSILVSSLWALSWIFSMSLT